MDDRKELKASDGSRWALFKRYDIPDRRNPNKLYLSRLRIIQTPWFGIYLHKIMLPDSYDMHDHPWDFASLILWGGYLEYVNKNPEKRAQYPVVETHNRRIFSFARRKSDWSHRIAAIQKPTWTLVFVGKRKRVWGFYTMKGWVPYYSYKLS